MTRKKEPYVGTYIPSGGGKPTVFIERPCDLCGQKVPAMKNSVRPDGSFRCFACRNLEGKA